MSYKSASEVRPITGPIPVTECSDSDVFIIGYPKSGITWLQNLIIGIIYELDPEFTLDPVVQELVPDVHYKSHYRRHGPRTFFKSHDLPRPCHRNVVYLLRDGRDVMVSYYHFLKALHGLEIDFLRMVREGERLWPCKWKEHVEAWLWSRRDSRMIIMRFEDLKTNPIRELQRFCEFVGVSREDSFLELTAAKAAFETMQAKETRHGWDNPAWPRDKFFVRRGVVGSYKDEMPKQVLEVFMQDSGETLLRCGYCR